MNSWQELETMLAAHNTAREVYMELLRISAPHTQTEAEIFACCCQCGRATKWIQAFKDGWVFDIDGEPFRAYYCPDCKPTNN